MYQRIYQVFLSFLSTLLSIALGSVSIVLIGKYDQNRAVLIIITCSSILYGLTNVFFTVVLKNQNDGFKYYNKLKLIWNILSQIIILCCSIQLFDNTFTNLVLLEADYNFNQLQQRLIVSFCSLLIFSLYVNGLNISNLLYADNQSTRANDEEKSVSVDTAGKEKSYKPRIPLKISSQTLTPEMDLNNIPYPDNANGPDLFSNINTQSVFPDMGYDAHLPHSGQNTRDSSGNLSFPSVIKRKMSTTITPHISTLQNTNEHFITPDNFEILSKPKKFMKELSLKKFNIIGNSSTTSTIKRKNSNSSVNNIVKIPTNKEQNKKTKYVTRLSVISDMSKNMLSQIASPSGSNLNNDKEQEIIEAQRYDRKNNRLSTIIIDSSFNPSNSSNLPIGINPNVDENNARIEVEKQALGRINSVLLPPILTPSQAPKLQQQGFLPNTMPEMLELSDNEIEFQKSFQNVNDEQEIDKYSFNEDFLENNDLQSISKVPIFEEPQNEVFETKQFGLSINDLPGNVSLEMWNKEKDELMNRANILQANLLLPAFNFSKQELKEIDDDISSTSTIDAPTHFSFPAETKRLFATTIKPNLENIEHDNISQLDQYLNDVSHQEDEEEIHMFEEGLNQNLSSSNIIGHSSKELSRINTRHSPTKSIISIISAGTSIHQRQKSHPNSGILINSSPHKRANSQLSNYLNSQNHHSTILSPPSSPTRSMKFRMLGKKLSISNLSDSLSPIHSTDMTISNSFNYQSYEENQGAGVFSKHKKRGQSIDFSYLHSLQSGNSPSKLNNKTVSRSESFKGKHTTSTAMDKNLRTVSSFFYLQQQNSATPQLEDKTNQILSNEDKRLINNQNLFTQRSYSNTSNGVTSTSSKSDYPAALTSEYDREKWNSIQNINSDLIKDFAL